MTEREPKEPMQRSSTLLLSAVVSACGAPAPRAETQPSHGSGQPHSHERTKAGGHGHGAHGHHAHGHHGFTNADEWAKVFDDPERDAWQQPDEVLRALELRPSMVVADVGAGTGYFAVRLARALPEGQVLATDLEPDMVRFLGERAAREQLPNLRPIQATSTASGLVDGSVDRILVVNVWHHIEHRVHYARDLVRALRPDGKLFVVEFTLTASHGPPPEMRLAPDTVIAELAAAGLTAKVSPVELPDQYIVEASRAR